MHLLLIYSCSYLSEDMTAMLYAPGLYSSLGAPHLLPDFRLRTHCSPFLAGTPSPTSPSASSLLTRFYSSLRYQLGCLLHPSLGQVSLLGSPSSSWAPLTLALSSGNPQSLATYLHLALGCGLKEGRAALSQSPLSPHTPQHRLDTGGAQ